MGLAQQLDAGLRALEVVIPLVGADAEREIARPNFAALDRAIPGGRRRHVEHHAHALFVGAIDLKFRRILTSRLEVRGDCQDSGDSYGSVGGEGCA
jgi:hypothetical protein